MKKIGVLSIQGDVSEHISAMRVAVDSYGLEAAVSEVKTANALGKVDALVFPGGESTTIGKLLKTFRLGEEIVRLASGGVPILGTCAGLVLLAKEGDEQVKKTGQPLLGLMDVKVARNSFGRQRESFQADLDIPVLGKKPFPGVFIRAPVVERAGEGVEVLCIHEKKIVMARQKNLLGLSFHPELTEDVRVHELFLGMIG